MMPYHLCDIFTLNCYVFVQLFAMRVCTGTSEHVSTQADVSKQMCETKKVQRKGCKDKKG